MRGGLISQVWRHSQALRQNQRMIDIETGVVEGASAAVPAGFTAASMPPCGTSPIDVSCTSVTTPQPSQVQSVTTRVSKAISDLSSQDKKSLQETRTADTENAEAIRSVLRHRS